MNDVSIQIEEDELDLKEWNWAFDDEGTFDDIVAKISRNAIAVFLKQIQDDCNIAWIEDDRAIQIPITEGVIITVDIEKIIDQQIDIEPDNSDLAALLRRLADKLEHKS